MRAGQIVARDGDLFLVTGVHQVLGKLWTTTHDGRILVERVYDAARLEGLTRPTHERDAERRWLTPIQGLGLRVDGFDGTTLRLALAADPDLPGWHGPLEVAVPQGVRRELAEALR